MNEETDRMWDEMAPSFDHIFDEATFGAKQYFALYK